MKTWRATSNVHRINSVATSFANAKRICSENENWLRTLRIQRTAALRLFFVATLRKPWAIAETPYPRKTFRLPKILSTEQVSRLINAAPTPFYRILLMTLYATGLRRAELAHLTVSDINRERMVVHVKGGKGRKDRDVMLSPKLLAELECYLRGLRRPPELWLFPGNRWHTGKRPITTKVIWAACREAATRAGLGDEIHPHTLRHCFATHLLESGPICAPSNFCSAIAIWKRPRSTCTFPTLA